MTYVCVAMRVANPCYVYYLWFYQLNGDNGVVFLPKAGRTFLIVAELQCFSLTNSTTVKNHTKAIVSRSQTAFSSFMFGRERPNIKEEKAVWLRETGRRETTKAKM